MFPFKLMIWAEMSFNGVKEIVICLRKRHCMKPLTSKWGQSQLKHRITLKNTKLKMKEKEFKNKLIMFIISRV